MDFSARRQAVFNKLPENSLVLCSSAPMQFRNSDAEHLFRQESYFHYLTGFNESFAIAAFVKNKNGNKFILFCQDRDKNQERWSGTRAGLKGAREQFGADEAYSISEASIRFPELFHEIHQVYYIVGMHPAFEKKVFSWINAMRKQQRKGITIPYKFIDLRTLLDEMRLIKSPEEISAMRKACDITLAGHRRAMKAASPDLYEYSLEAELLYAFYQGGSRHVAYNPIVASANNACTLHYVENKDKLKDNTLVLIDAGCEYENYAADVTRTFPVNGKFTSEQQALYECVLASQLAAIKSIKPGAPWNEAQKIIVEVLVTGLVELRILQGDIKELIEKEAYKKFYMHNSGHWLGLDVHDVGDYKINNQWRPLQPGMVLTVEPGLYIDQDENSVPAKYRGIGIRIEDDILVTDQGCEVLTRDVPKTVAEIESFMKKH